MFLNSLNSKDNRIRDSSAEYLGKALLQNTTLKELILSNCDFHDGGIGHISNSIATKNSFLLALDLSREYLRNPFTPTFKENCLSDFGMEFVAEIISANSTILSMAIGGFQCC